MARIAASVPSKSLGHYILFLPSGKVISSSQMIWATGRQDLTPVLPSSHNPLVVYSIILGQEQFPSPPP